MGNESSTEVVKDEKQFLDGLAGMSLDNADVDAKINAGTSTANWKTRAELEEERMARLMAEAADTDGSSEGAGGAGGNRQRDPRAASQQGMDKKPCWVILAPLECSRRDLSV